VGGADEAGKIACRGLAGRATPGRCAGGTVRTTCGRHWRPDPAGPAWGGAHDSRTYRRGERIEHFETVRIRKDGSLVDISLTVSPVKNAEGKIIGASKIARDVTEQKRNQAQIAILAREAEHRAKNVLATVQATVHLTQSDTADGLKHAIEGTHPGARERPQVIRGISLGRGRDSQRGHGRAGRLLPRGRDTRADRRPKSVA
jgi:hypothetical protein